MSGDVAFIRPMNDPLVILNLRKISFAAKRLSFSLLLVFCLIFSLPAAGMGRFKELFSECFFKCYRSGKCHGNALHFLLKAKQEGLDITPAAYWDLTPYQGGHFYMINVYESARGAGTVREAPYDWMPLENWFNHGIIVYQENEEEPTVFDFDYKNVPTPVPFSVYRQDLYYRRHNDQILKVKVYSADRILSSLSTNEPDLAYEPKTWVGVGNPDDTLLLSEHSLTSMKD